MGKLGSELLVAWWHAGVGLVRGFLDVGAVDPGKDGIGWDGGACAYQ